MVTRRWYRRQTAVPAWRGGRQPRGRHLTFFRHCGVGLQVAPWFVLPATTAQSGCGDWVTATGLGTATRWRVQPGPRSDRRTAAGWRPSHRHRRRRRHRAGLAAGRHDLASRSAPPTRTGKCCRRSRQPHRDCGRSRHRCLPASTPPPPQPVRPSHNALGITEPH